MGSVPVEPRRSPWGAVGEYAAAAALSLALLAWLYALPGRDLRVPLSFTGDAFDALLSARLIVDRGWPLSHPDLGAPHGLDLHDFQQSCTAQHALMAALSLAVRDPFLLTNCYFLLTFPLTAVVGLAVLRRLGLGFVPSLVASLLFAFLPYHHLRGVTHLYLAAYCLVPVSVLLALQVILEEPLFGRGPGVTTRGRALAAGLAVLVGSWHIYYAFFTCFLLLAAGSVVVMRHRRWAAGRSAAVLVGVVSVTSLLGLAPQALYQLRHGPNPQVGSRSRWDAQNYDLRIVQMLLPVSGHRVGPVRRAKEKMNSQIVGVNENDYVSLGALPSVGFLFLVGLAFRPGGETRRSRLLFALATLNLATLLLATKGGFGLMVAWALPQIRCYNRLSVFLAFFSVVALAHLLEACLCQGRWRRLGLVACLSLVVAGAFDQTPRIDPPDVSGYHADGEFVRRVGEVVPPGGMVLQLPFQSFPEGHAASHLRFSLRPGPLRWSHPAMRGRYPDLYLRETCRLRAEPLAERLCWAGFAGVCWDRSVSAEVVGCGEADLRRVLGPPAAVHPNGTCAFYSVSAHAERLRGAASAGDAERLRLDALYPVVPRWKRGFQGGEPSAGEGRWGNARGAVEFMNPSGLRRAVRLELLVKSSPAGPGRLRLSGLGADVCEAVGEQPRWVGTDLDLPAGNSELRLDCSAPCDPRHARRHYCVLDFRILTGPRQDHPVARQR